MSHYSDRPEHVRVDFFKPTGKWYTTEQVDMTGFYDELTGDAVKHAVARHLGDRLRGMYAVCLDPYCEHSFPVMFMVSGPIVRQGRLPV